MFRRDAPAALARTDALAQPSALARPTALAERVASGGRSLLRYWQARPVVVRDALPAVALALLAYCPPLARHGTRLGELPYRHTDAVAVLAALTQSLPLAARRRWPAGVLAACAAGFAVQDVRGYASFAGLGLILALYNGAAYQSRMRQPLVAALTAGYVLLAWAEHEAGSPAAPQDFVVFYLCLAACWLFGSWVRAQRQHDAERRRQATAEVRTAERARIARELHDVVTHHVTAIVVQANAAQYLVSQPEQLAANLGAISQTGRRALSELRDLLGVLDATRSAPLEQAPDLTEVAALVEQTRAAGQPVEFGSRGRQPELGAGREQAAYRVVQEALTNAMKYAAGRRTQVRLDYRPDGVDIAVTTAGPGPHKPVEKAADSTVENAADKAVGNNAVGGSGRGLVGLSERVELFGGSLTAGPDDTGGFAVRARIPAAAGNDVPA
ncbi:sensor histidine kinase [Rugosimonospora africana]|nr:histidine kinase [Rugosimonospora africana]